MQVTNRYGSVPVAMALLLDHRSFARYGGVAASGYPAFP
jgi:hypothetical protein